MTTGSIIDIVVLAAVLVWMVVRQLTWHPLDLRRIWTAPVILMGAGILIATGGGRFGGGPVRLDAVSLGLVAVEAVAGAGIGAAMGRMARFRRLDTPVLGRGGALVTWQYRTGRLGAVLWVALIVLRIGIDVGARMAGLGGLVTSTGVILVIVGLNRLATAAVLHHRYQRVASLVAA